jgi:hypothetical protein
MRTSRARDRASLEAADRSSRGSLSISKPVAMWKSHKTRNLRSSLQGATTKHMEHDAEYCQRLSYIRRTLGRKQRSIVNSVGQLNLCDLHRISGGVKRQLHFRLESRDHSQSRGHTKSELALTLRHSNKPRIQRLAFGEQTSKAHSTESSETAPTQDTNKCTLSATLTAVGEIEQGYQADVCPIQILEEGIMKTQTQGPHVVACKRKIPLIRIERKALQLIRAANSSYTGSLIIPSAHPPFQILS